MTTLEKLREQNPNLKIKSVTDEVFAEFGQLIALPYQAQLAEQLSLTTIPARNNQYVRDDPGMLSGEQKKVRLRESSMENSRLKLAIATVIVVRLMRWNFIIVQKLILREQI